MGDRVLTAGCNALGEWNSWFFCLEAAVMGGLELNAGSSAVGG